MEVSLVLVGLCRGMTRPGMTLECKPIFGPSLTLAIGAWPMAGSLETCQARSLPIVNRARPSCHLFGLHFTCGK